MLDLDPFVAAHLDHSNLSDTRSTNQPYRLADLLTTPAVTTQLPVFSRYSNTVCNRHLHVRNTRHVPVVLRLPHQKTLDVQNRPRRPLASQGNPQTGSHHINLT